jgi:hypothetical protein
MRIYIIGNDGITLCREAPATVNEGEIAVASKEELHAARLSGKRLLALWNALPAVEKRRKVGDRAALIDQLWSAIEALSDPDQQSDTKGASKQAAVIAMLQRPEGITIEEALSRQLRRARIEAKTRLASCCCDGILPLYGRFGSEDPQCGSGDEVALNVEGVVNRTVQP